MRAGTRNRNRPCRRRIRNGDSDTQTERPPLPFLVRLPAEAMGLAADMVMGADYRTAILSVADGRPARHPVQLGKSRLSFHASHRLSTADLSLLRLSLDEPSCFPSWVA